MARACWLFLGMWFGLIAGAAQAGGQAASATAPAAAAPAQKTCTVDRGDPTPAEQALNKKDYGAAETLFGALLEKRFTRVTEEDLAAMNDLAWRLVDNVAEPFARNGVLELSAIHEAAL